MLRGIGIARRNSELEASDVARAGLSTSPHYPIAFSSDSIQALLATPFPSQGRFVGMKKSLRERLFGAKYGYEEKATELKKEKTLAKINEPDPAPRPRARRTVGLTEARLRAANQQSWMTSGKGWSDFLGRFTRPSRS